MRQPNKKAVLLSANRSTTNASGNYFLLIIAYIYKHIKSFYEKH